jgi:putative FmdB family regulatory protein
MPTFTYNCKCGNTFTDLAKASEVVKCPKCGEGNAPSMPSRVSATVMETRDKYRGKQVKRGVEKELKERMRKHHDRYEVAEKIDQFGMNEAVKHGWLKKVKKV